MQARISRRPCRMADLLPEIARLQRLVHLAICPADQVPVLVAFNRTEEFVRQRNGIVRVLAGNGQIGFRIPIRVVGREVDIGITLLGELDDALDVIVRHHRAAGEFDFALQRRVLLRVEAGLVRPFAIDAGLHHGLQMLGAELGTGDESGHLLLFLHLPVDIGFDIRMIGIDNDHLGRAARCTTRFDRARRAVADLEEAHQAR